MKKDFTTVYKGTKEEKEIRKALNDASLRKTISVCQGLPYGETGFRGKKINLSVAKFNLPNFYCKFDIFSNDNFIDDLRMYATIKQTHQNSYLILDVELYNEKNEFVAIARLLPESFSVEGMNAYEFIYHDCLIGCNDKLYDERSN